jgi:hypothetical protein
MHASGDCRQQLSSSSFPKKKRASIEVADSLATVWKKLKTETNTVFHQADDEVEENKQEEDEQNEKEETIHSENMNTIKEYYRNGRVASSDSNGNLSFGTVVADCQKDDKDFECGWMSWKVQYDNGSVVEDWDWNDLHQGLKLCQHHQQQQQETKNKTAACQNNKKNKDPYRHARVAKFFDQELYFGTIVESIGAGKDQLLWKVQYDDGDSEDWDLPEVVQGLKLGRQDVDSAKMTLWQNFHAPPDYHPYHAT